MKKIQVDSASWTGEMPPAIPPKKPSRFQYSVTLALFIFGIFHGGRMLADGLSTGRMKPPIRFGSYVTMDTPALFALCVAGWLVALLLSAFFIRWSIKGLLRREPR